MCSTRWATARTTRPTSTPCTSRSRRGRRLALHAWRQAGRRTASQAHDVADGRALAALDRRLAGARRHEQFPPLFEATLEPGHDRIQGRFRTWPGAHGQGVPARIASGGGPNDLARPHRRQEPVQVMAVAAALLPLVLARNRRTIYCQ